VPDSPEAKAAQVIVEEYARTNMEFDADGLMALYGEDVFWMDHGSGDGPLSRGNLDYFVHETMADQGSFGFRLESYLITPDGRFAALQVCFSMYRAFDGKRATAPCTVLLEFGNGHIISETWYYNGDHFH